MERLFSRGGDRLMPNPLVFPAMQRRKRQEDYSFMVTTLRQPLNNTSTQSQEAALTIAQSLSHILADTYLLYLKTQNFHWNVHGNLFYGLHNLLEEQYKALAIAVDDIAERIRVLGLSAPGSFRQFLELSSLQEAQGLAAPEAMIAELATDHMTLTEKLKGVLHQAEQNHDVATAELLSGRIRTHEKQAWMLNSIVR